MIKEGKTHGINIISKQCARKIKYTLSYHPTSTQLHMQNNIQNISWVAEEKIKEKAKTMKENEAKEA